MATLWCWAHNLNYSFDLLYFLPSTFLSSSTGLCPRCSAYELWGAAAVPLDMMTGSYQRDQSGCLRWSSKAVLIHVPGIRHLLPCFTFPFWFFYSCIKQLSQPFLWKGCGNSLFQQILQILMICLDVEVPIHDILVPFCYNINDSQELPLIYGLCLMLGRDGHVDKSHGMVLLHENRPYLSSWCIYLNDKRLAEV